MRHHTERTLPNGFHPEFGPVPTAPAIPTPAMVADMVADETRRAIRRAVRLAVFAQSAEIAHTVDVAVRAELSRLGIPTDLSDPRD